MNIKSVQNKLLKNGYLPQSQGQTQELWIDVKRGGTSISFLKNDAENDIDVFKVHGSLPDRAEFDEFNSYYTDNLSEAIRVSRASSKN